MKKDYKILFCKMKNQPNWVKVKEDFTPYANVSGDLVNIEDVPGADTTKTSFEMDIFCEMQISYKWANMRGKWTECDEAKYLWCKENNIHCKKLYTYVK